MAALRSSIICAAGATAVAAPKQQRALKPLNVTVGSLQSYGQTTRNIDGVVYELSYSSTDDSITVVDRAQRIQYPAVVGAKDNRISIAIDEPIYLPGPPTFEQLQAVLRGDAVGPEFINGRVAMLAFLGCAGMELATQKTVLEQALSPSGALAAVALVALTTAASIAPALAGKERVEHVFPSEANYTDRQMPFYFTPLAETQNARAAMLGLLGLLGYELVKGTPLF